MEETIRNLQPQGGGIQAGGQTPPPSDSTNIKGDKVSLTETTIDNVWNGVIAN